MFRNTLAAGVVASISEASNPYEAYARLVRAKTGVDIVGYMEPEPVINKYDPYMTLPEDIEEEVIDEDIDDVDPHPHPHHMKTHHQHMTYEDMAHEMMMDEEEDEEENGDEDGPAPVCKIMGPDGECYRSKEDLVASGYHGDPIEIDYTAPVFSAKKIHAPLHCDVWALDGECNGRVVALKK